MSSSLRVCLTLVVFLTCRCSGSPTKTQLHAIVKEILFEDVMNAELLSERIKLDAADVPSMVRNLLQTTDDIDPLVALHSLMRSTDTAYSGQELTVSIKIVGTTLMCLTYKRVAVHLVLTNRLMALETEKKKCRTRLEVFSNVLPYYIDMLSAIGDKHLALLKVFGRIAEMLSAADEDLSKPEFQENLNQELTSLNQNITSSCTEHQMSEYFKKLHIATEEDFTQYPEIFTDLNVSESVQLPTIIAWIKENENDIIDMYDAMYSIKNMHMRTWKSLLKYPNMPVEDFIRRPLPSYRDELRNVLEKRFHSTADVLAKKHDEIEFKTFALA